MLLLLKKYWLHLLLVVVALSAAWYWWAPQPAPPEVPAAEARQADGSLTLQKAPDKKHQPPHAIPKKGKVERDIEVMVQPTHGPDAAGNCPPVKVNLSLVRNEDRTKRVVASSPDGRVTGGLDIPVDDALPTPEPKLWAAGAVIDPFKQTFGGFVDRDLGWLRVGVQLNQRNEGDFPNEAWIKAGVRF